MKEHLQMGLDMDQEASLLRSLKKRRQQVEYLLENYPAARNNDFYLQWLWLKIFGKLPLPFIDWQRIHQFSGSLEGVRRVRQRIQNDDGLFPPTDPEVKEAREKRSKAMRRVIGKV